MKTTRNFLQRSAVTLCCIVLCTFAISSCKKSSTANNNPYTVSGNGTGAQMVPSVSGNGASTMTGTYDPTTHTLSYTINLNNLSGAPTSGGFSTGASGSNGTSFGSPWVYGSNLSGTGSVSGSSTLTADQANQLTSGNMYYTIGTASNSGGEVRGQMSATR